MGSHNASSDESFVSASLSAPQATLAERATCETPHVPTDGQRKLDSQTLPLSSTKAEDGNELGSNCFTDQRHPSNQYMESTDPPLCHSPESDLSELDESNFKDIEWSSLLQDLPDYQQILLDQDESVSAPTDPTLSQVHPPD